MTIFEGILAFALGLGCVFVSRRVAGYHGIHWDSEKRDRIGLLLLATGGGLAYWLGWRALMILLIGAVISLYGNKIRAVLSGRSERDGMGE